MIGVVLIAHAHIASETKAAVEHILGEQSHFGAIDIANSDASSHEKKALNDAIESLDNGHGVLILVDLMGSTPWNIAQRVSENNHVEWVAGFNLPAVIRAITLRHDVIQLQELASASVDAGRKYMCLGNGCEDLKVS